MKKIYTKPQMVEIPIKISNQILVGSNMNVYDPNEEIDAEDAI